MTIKDLDNLFVDDKGYVRACLGGNFDGPSKKAWDSVTNLDEAFARLGLKNPYHETTQQEHDRAAAMILEEKKHVVYRDTTPEEHERAAIDLGLR